MNKILFNEFSIMLNNKKDTVNKELDIVEKHKKETYVFDLFVSGNSMISTRTIHNALSIFNLYLKDRFELKIIDANKEKTKVIKEHIIVLPMLIKKQPFPEVRIVGDLSDTKNVLKDLLIE